MTTILGLDISSFRLDGALLWPYRPTFRNITLGTSKQDLTERVRNIPSAVEKLTRVGLNDLMDFTGGVYARPDWVVIEEAYGPSGRARKALDLVTGAIIASVFPQSQVKLLKASQWRSYLGAKNTKEDGHDKVMLHSAGHGCDLDTIGMCDEHQLDALGVALGWGLHLQKEV